MSIIEQQALAGMNETLDTVKKMQDMHKDVEQHVTLITFDSTHTNFIFNDALAGDIHTLSAKDYCPKGATPLYDAIGLGISKINAIAQDDDNVLVTIITDGEENCSTEYSLKMVKTLIEKLKKQKWTFTLIGTDNLDVEDMASGMSIDNHLKFAEDAEGTINMFKKELRCRMKYNDYVAKEKLMADIKYFDDAENLEF